MAGFGALLAFSDPWLTQTKPLLLQTLMPGRYLNSLRILCGMACTGAVGLCSAQWVPNCSQALPVELPSLNLPAVQLPPLLSPTDAFCEPPNPLPAGAPGTVIRSRKLAVSSIPIATAHQIMFISTNVQGERIAITGRP